MVTAWLLFLVHNLKDLKIVILYYFVCVVIFSHKIFAPFIAPGDFPKNSSTLVRYHGDNVIYICSVSQHANLQKEVAV